MSSSNATPAPGAPRREGRGYIDSFGEGRSCAVPDCPTVLSRYNDKSVCSVHEEPSRGSR